jgi:hypothetical protein
MAAQNVNRIREIDSYHTAHASHRKGNFIECNQCYRVYIEDLICQDSKTRLDFCIRCYNRRDDAQKIKTKREIIERVRKNFESSAKRTP